MEEEESILKEFLEECSEGLDELDQQFVSLEKEPTNADLLGSIFRTIHTIKGTCGFLGLAKLENVAHGTENVLSLMRDGKFPVTPEGVTVLLEAVDIIKEIISYLESGGIEPDKNYDGMRQKLDALLAGDPVLEQPGSQGQTEPETGESNSPPIAPEIAKQAAQRDQANKPDKLEKPVQADKTNPSIKSFSKPESSIRVDVRLLDILMNLVGELVLARNQLLQQIKGRDDTEDLGPVQRMNLVTTELQDTVMKTRMQPIRNVWDKYPRVVRDLSRELKKEVELIMEGADTEMDKTLIEAIKDPLIHVVRNALDHGIETPDIRKAKGKATKGTLRLKAFHEGGKVNILIADDGGGLNTEKIKQKAIDKGLMTSEAVSLLSDRDALRLIFLPGFSTAEKVTTTSGRGVGMDVVRSNIEKIAGTAEIESTLGQGTTISIKLPLTLAIIQALIIRTGKDHFAIPQAGLLELVRMDTRESRGIEVIHGAEFYRLRGMLLPILRLDRILKLTDPSSSQGEEARPKEEKGSNIAVLEFGGHTFGLLVDEVKDSEEIVVKPVGKLLKDLGVFTGATIMGNGTVSLILDVAGVAKEGGLLESKVEDKGSQRETSLNQEVGMDLMILLIFSISEQDRFAVPLSLVTRLEEFDPSSIEHTVGGQVIQYRGSLLPLIYLEDVLGIPPPNRSTLPVIVFSDEGKMVGVVVGKILDIIEERLAIYPSSGNARGVHGSVVVKGKTTDVIDIYEIIESAIPGRFIVKKFGDNKKNIQILLVEDSEFFRKMVKQFLEVQGYSVTEACDGVHALEELSKGTFDLVCSDIEMPRMDGFELARRIRSHPDYANIPLLALTSLSSKENKERGLEAGFQLYTPKFDQGTILSALNHLLQKEEHHV